MAGVIGSIGPFDESTEQWSSYTERFGYFVAANDIQDDKLVPIFLSVIGPKTFNLLRSLLQPAKPGNKSFTEIVDTLTKHFSPKPLVIAERFRFHKRNQEEGESVTMFVASLRKLAEHCEFKDVLNDTLRDRLVCGLRNEAAQKKLLTESDLTLEKAINISVTMEMASKEAHALHATDRVHKLDSGKANAQGPCFRCGKLGHLASDCWCKEMDCNNCGKKGHVARACRNKKSKDKGSKTGNKRGTAKFKKERHVRTVKLHEDRVSDSSDEEVLSAINTVRILNVDETSDGFWVKPKLEGHVVKMQIDTGSKASLVSYNVYRKCLKHLPLKPSDTVFKGYTGHRVPMKGMTEVTVQCNDQTAKLPVYVTQKDCPAIMGRVWLKAIRLNWQEVRKLSHGSSQLQAILGKHKEVFREELGSMKKITVKLHLKPDSKPVFMKARPVPYAIRPKVESNLDALVKNGVLEPVTTSEWATPIVPVPKKDGGIRICGDFKVSVNPVLTAEQYPLPLIDDLFAGLSGGQKFSKIDLNQAYLQMHVEEQSRDMLTINTHKGLFRYCRLPFGITSAPALFQRAIDQILSGLPGVQCYLDDILCTGADDEEHLRNLDATLQRLKEYGLRVRKEKCDFFQSSVEYLGHVIDANGLHTAPSKITAIVDAPPPQNVSQLKSFLGLLNYYGRFIPNLASLLKPLHNLLRKEEAWKWTASCQEAFQKAKDSLTASEVLTHFNPKFPIQLACDASPYGVGAVISHILPNGEERPIAFASRTLNTAETNYAQLEREALSIVFGVRKFHQYLYGRKFTLLTDHRPLTTILGPYTGIPSLAASRLQRWALILSGHSYDIKYRKSESHCNADGLSRLPLPVRKPVSDTVEILYFREVETAPVSAVQVKKASRNDPVLSAVMDWIIKGLPAGEDVDLKAFLGKRAELSVQAGCLLWGRRVIIPLSLQTKLLKQLHAGHSGIVRMKEIARSYFWWPNMDKQIEEIAKNCSSCHKVRNNPPLAPLHPWEFPQEPWHRVHIDFAGPYEDKMFLVAVDAHSKWPEVTIMKSTTTEKTIEALGEMFSRFGSPTQIVSDNGPQLVSQEMEAFLQANGVQHITSAPYHPATNGLAERFVQTMKHALKTSQGQGTLHQRLHRFLLNYRNSPHATTRTSPANAMFKRDLRTTFDLLKPATVKDTVQKQQEKQIMYRGQQVKNRVFSPGESVLARNYRGAHKWVPATVIAQTGPVSYTVQVADGVWRRHVDQLLQTAPVSAERSFEDLKSALIDSSVPPHMQVENSTASGKVVPTVNETARETETSSVTETKAPQESTQTDVTTDRRYPNRERRPPVRLSY
uniref:Gypsy retrotransposon integrase-like protein 1 n=1 Tax=Oreochromis niloticus TaxID=8128 RepID=A0A669DC14_ORENI